METTLDQMQERYALATAAAKVGVWDWNLETGAFYLDPNIKRLLGYEDHEIPNDIEIWARYIHPDDAEAVMTAAQDVIEGRSPEYVYEHRMVHKDGSVRWFMVRGTVLRNEAGAPIRFVGTDTDITDRRMLEERLDELSSEVQTRIGHDLHDSLAQELAGLAFILKSLERKLEEEGSASKDRAILANELLNHAIAETRALARGLSPLLGTSEPADAFRQLARRAEDVFGVNCEVDIPSGIPGNSKSTFPNHLYHIAQEAITNAVKHGGATHIRLGCTHSDRGIVLTIEDNGVGIDESEDRGTGMGLRIMNHRARSLGGDLTINRRSNGGTIVTCAVPLPGA